MKDLNRLRLPDRPHPQPSALLLGGALLFHLLSLCAHATPGLEGTFEYAIDAPWRVEPSTDSRGRISYGKLPLIVAILDENVIRHDSNFPPPVNNRPFIRPVTGLGKFGQVRVKMVDISQPVGSRSRIIAQQTYGLRDLYEIEKSQGSWETSGPNPTRRLCRVWAGDSTVAMEDLSNTSEWHAMLWFDIPANLAPGTDLHLEAEVDLTGDRGLTYSQALANPQQGNATPANLITLKNSLKVHLGEAPLPRFDQGTWAYGDLHYHSQGTDNEGESGYSYRGVLHAMGAMGLDFTFATDHASDSRQFVDADLVGKDLGEFIDGVTGGSYDPDVTDYVGPELRDMNAARFRALWESLNEGPTAANAEIAQRANGIPAQLTLTSGFAPQVFLGGELDTVNEAGESDAARWTDWEPFYDLANFSVPEQGLTLEPDPDFEVDFDGTFDLLAKLARLDETGTPSALKNGWTIRYGNGLEYSLFNLAGSYLPEKSGAKIRHDNDLLDGFGPRALRILSDYWQGRGGFEGYPIFDVQGINDIGYTRAHLVYLPGNPDDKNAFISSQTGKYGGGTRPMVDRRPGRLGLFEEIEQKGYAFLAHSIGPMNEQSEGSNGPDSAPWSEHMYETAWASRSILGLQFWNENVRFKTEIKERSTKGREIGYEQPAGEFEGVKRFQRKGFLTGKFEMFPFNRDSAWDHQERNVTDIAATLHHGSFTWDKILRWGLDLEKTAALDWLPAGEPRKFFMSGGSDAHGDLNYRREGYLTGTSTITDSAIASVRNLVRVPNPSKPRAPRDGVLTTATAPTQLAPSTSTTTSNVTFSAFSVDTSAIQAAILQTGTFSTGTLAPEPDVSTPTPPAPTLSQADVTDALRAGEFCVTDGPILRIAIDVNDNGVIDSTDTPMGGTLGMFSILPNRDDLKLLVEWKSTPEFGAIRKIDLYVGSHNSASVRSGDGRTYTSASHGPRENFRIPESKFDASTSYRNGSGALYGMLSDNYWSDPSGRLRIEFTESEIAAGVGFSGTRSVHLDLNSFPADGSAGQRDVLADRHYIRAFATTYLPPIITFTGDDPAECFADIPDKLLQADPEGGFHDICEDLDIEVTSIVHRGSFPARYAFTNPVWIKRGFSRIPTSPVGQVMEFAPEESGPAVPSVTTVGFFLGGTPSNPAPKPSLVVSAPDEGGIMLRWTCVPNWTYAVEHSSDLRRWAQISRTSTTQSTGSFWDLDPTRLAGSRGFYRVRAIDESPRLETDFAVFQFVPRAEALR